MVDYESKPIANLFNQDDGEVEEPEINLNFDSIMATMQQQEETEKCARTRGSRLRMLHGNYIMSYDKMSSCGTRLFWRCERKKECPARLHTSPHDNKVVRVIREHNHVKLTVKELLKWEKVDENAVASDEYLIAVVRAGTVVKQNRKDSDIGSTALILNQQPLSLEDIKDVQKNETGEPSAKRARESLGLASSSPEVVTPETSEDDLDRRVSAFFEFAKYPELKEKFEKYTMEDLRALSLSQWKEIMVDLPAAFLIYNRLHPYETKENTRIYIRESPDEPFYMLHPRCMTRRSLETELKKNKIFVEEKMFCISVEDGCEVYVTDEVVSTWKDGFRFEINKSATKFLLRQIV